MRFVLLLLLLSLVSQSSAEDERYMPRVQFKALQDLLRKDWIVKESEEGIRIESAFDVYMVAMGSRMNPPPEFTDAITTRDLEKETRSTKYVISLKYVKPCLSREELAVRKRERLEVGLLLLSGVRSKEAWADAVKKFESIDIPRYPHLDSGYDAYRVLPEGIAAKIYPPEAVRKIAAAKELIDRAFGYLPYDGP
jgi:hypothetical protein